MTLDYILLGVLMREPMSGYDVNKFYQYVLKYFLPADQRKIYRALKRMHDNGWLDADVVVQETSPNKKVYRITPMGEAELRSWLSSPMHFNYSESGIWLAQLFFGAYIDPETTITNLQSRRQQLASQLREFERRAGVTRPDPDTDFSRFMPFNALTLHYGMHVTRWHIQWLDEAIAYINHINELTLETVREFFLTGHFPT